MRYFAATANMKRITDVKERNARIMDVVITVVTVSFVVNILANLVMDYIEGHLNYGYSAALTFSIILVSLAFYCLYVGWYHYSDIVPLSSNFGVIVVWDSESGDFADMPYGVYYAPQEIAKRILNSLDADAKTAVKTGLRKETNFPDAEHLFMALLLRVLSRLPRSFQMMPTCKFYDEFLLDKNPFIPALEMEKFPLCIPGVFDVEYDWDKDTLDWGLSLVWSNGYDGELTIRFTTRLEKASSPYAVSLPRLPSPNFRDMALKESISANLHEALFMVKYEVRIHADFSRLKLWHDRSHSRELHEWTCDLFERLSSVFDWEKACHRALTRVTSFGV